MNRKIVRSNVVCCVLVAASQMIAAAPAMAETVNLACDTSAAWLKHVFWIDLANGTITRGSLINGKINGNLDTLPVTISPGAYEYRDGVINRVTGVANLRNADGGMNQYTCSKSTVALPTTRF